MSVKNVDQQGRHRNKIVAFRVSPEEADLINEKVKLSGLTKQDYILKRLEEKEIVVMGNPKVYKALKDELAKVLNELKRVKSGDAISNEVLSVIELIAVTLEGMNHENGK